MVGKSIQEEDHAQFVKYRRCGLELWAEHQLKESVLDDLAMTLSGQKHKIVALPCFPAAWN